MSTEREETLSKLLEENGLTWALAGDAGAAGRILGVLEATASEYRTHFGSDVDLLAAARAKPDEMRAFLQTLTAGVSPAFLALVARILLRGAKVVCVRFEFEARKTLSLHVEIADPDGRRYAFDSTDLWDVQILRHLGLMKAGGVPFIDGYYASGPWVID